MVATARWLLIPRPVQLDCGRAKINLREKESHEGLKFRFQTSSDFKFQSLERRIPRHRVLCAKSSGFCSSDTVIVWFKHDLRLDDHEGLASSLKADSVIPVYIFDPMILQELPRSIFPLLIEAVKELRAGLQGLGSNLVVRVGKSSGTLLSLSRKVGSTIVIAEDEVEHTWRKAITEANSLLTTYSESSGSSFALQTWSLSLHRFPEETLILEDFPSYKKSRLSSNPPIDAPTKLPPIHPSVEIGEIPSLSDLLEMVPDCPLPLPDSSHALYHPFWPDEKSVASLSPENSKDNPQHILNMFRGYLRFHEGTSNSQWQRMYRHILSQIEEGTVDSCFLSLFSLFISLGVLSVRRVYHEAVAYEKGRSGGILPLLGSASFTSKQACMAAEAFQYHYELAKSAIGTGGQRRGHKVRFWRWRGFLLEYTCDGEEGPPVLFVHGFGAFWEHFRDNIRALAASGSFRGYALTLPGFGRSEKPPVLFSQYLWTACVADFIAHVVQKPVALVGNSIGGYMTASMASDWPHLVTHLILMNSAGRIDLTYSHKASIQQRSRFPVPVANFIARLLMLYLQSSAKGILAKCYPVNPSKANQELVSEIIRASLDPGAVQILQSAFYLPPPRPLNFLLHQFNGPVLVLQGRLDPLNDATARARLISESYPKSKVVLVDAGHCPHDEVPELVNQHLTEFITGGLRS